MSTISLPTPRAAILPVAGDRLAPSREAVLTARVRLAGRLVALLLCTLHAYTSRHLINPDGISYLDVASTYARGDVAHAINAYWSPLYSWLLAAAFALLQPSAYWECTVAHGVNVAIFLVALVAFEWLVSELLVWRAAKQERLRERWYDLLPDWLVVGIGYALFVYVSRRLITVSLLTPDMIVAATVYASAAILLRLGRQPSPLLAGLLGVVLGLAYLAKGVMFPLALVFLAVLLGVTWRRGRRDLQVACLAFLVIAGPWIGALSASRGRFTIGDTGRLNYRWYVLGEPRPELRFGKGHTAPVLVHSGVGGVGSNPLWYDPSYHYDAAMPRFDLRAQLAACVKTTKEYASLFGDLLLPFTVSIFVLIAFSLFARRGRIGYWLHQGQRDLLRLAPLIIPALAGLGLYLLVGHVEGRLVGAFVVLLGLGLLAVLRVPHPRQTTIQPFGAALLAFLGLLLLGNLAFDAGKACEMARSGEPATAHPHWRVAQELRSLGVQPGDAVASIGFTYNAYWARLADCQCVAEVPFAMAGRFWTGSPALRTQMLTTCEALGARAVVSDCVPPGMPGWKVIEGTGFAVRPLSRVAQEIPAELPD